MNWKLDDLSVLLDEELSEGDVVTIKVVTPDGVIAIMGEVGSGRRALTVEGAHISSSGIAPNTIGIRNLRLIAAKIMDLMGYDSIRLQGAVRTTGANPQRTPGPLWFKRDRDASGGS